jgi:Flp pilus assembly protein TadG
MLLRTHRSRRRGAALVEAAFVYPITILLIIGVVVLGVGVFRYQQLTWLAREGARWASVRGPQYASDTGGTAATATNVSDHVKGKATGMDTSSITVTTTWTVNGTTGQTTSGSTTNKTEVVVVVSYTWVPEAYSGIFPGATLTTTAQAAMAY